MNDFVVLQTHPSMIDYVDGLQRKNAEALSFYPRQVFEREQAKGRLFLGMLNGEPCGYLYVGAHKVAWMLTNGYVPDGQCVLHKCDNRVCCNPAHFFLGTKTDNARDKIAKGRDPTMKLKPAQVLEIRAALQTPYYGIQRELARKYGVKHGVINDINTGETYQWVK